MSRKRPKIFAQGSNKNKKAYSSGSLLLLLLLLLLFLLFLERELATLTSLNRLGVKIRTFEGGDVFSRGRESQNTVGNLLDVALIVQVGSDEKITVLQPQDATSLQKILDVFHLSVWGV